MDPEDLGGVPAVMPTNNWWDNIATSAENAAASVISSAGSAASQRFQGAQPVSTSGHNPPPGGAGVMVQANATPGGALDQLKRAAGQMSGTTWALLAAALVGLMLLKARR